jgi:glycerol-3-phosphate dehydrogenase
MNRLFHSPLSPFCRKVRLTLAEKKIEVELIEERYWEPSPDFLRRNPRALSNLKISENPLGVLLAAGMIDVLGKASKPEDLGEDFGAGLTAREVAYFVREEWARTADDVLWRRSKCGIGMPPAQRERVAACVAAAVATLPHA